MKHILSPSSALRQHDAVPVCRHTGCDVILHGGQEVQDRFSGGPSVTRGQTDAGGAEHPASQWDTHTHNHRNTLLNEIIHFLIWGKHTHTRMHKHTCVVEHTDTVLPNYSVFCSARS